MPGAKAIRMSENDCKPSVELSDVKPKQFDFHTPDEWGHEWGQTPNKLYGDRPPTKFPTIFSDFQPPPAFRVVSGL
jgi:hypothetical protein